MDRHADTEQCSFAIAFKGASWTDPDSVPLMVMQTLLGKGGGEGGAGVGWAYWPGRWCGGGGSGFW